MMRQVDLQRTTLRKKLKERSIRLAGHAKFKIYGRLDCPSGKRMKPQNRVFFSNEAEAIGHGFRPCGHCMRQAYQIWISSQI